MKFILLQLEFDKCMDIIKIVPSCHAVIYSLFKFEGEQSGCGIDSLLGGQRSILMVNQIQCEMKAQEEYNHCTKLNKLLNT